MVPLKENDYFIHETFFFSLSLLFSPFSLVEMNSLPFLKTSKMDSKNFVNP